MKKRVVTPFHSDDAKNAVVAVGPSSGRGFVMEISVTVERITILNRMVVTAAHCLPELPAATGWFDVRDKTYPNLLGPLGIRKPSIMAECLFADPVADIAVLGAPDGQAYEDADMKWDDFMQRTSSLQLNARKMGRPTTAWLLSLDGRWTTCIVKSIQCGIG